MFEKLGNQMLCYAKIQPIWTNVYGLARTLLALSLMLTLLVNPAHYFFRPAAGIPDYPLCTNNLSLFCLVPRDYFFLELVKWIFILLLMVVASGWRPRFTGLIHFYIAFSFHSSAVSLDGGEQVNVVLTLLLLPITLTDKRKWHWEKVSSIDSTSTYALFAYITAFCAYMAIRIQMAIIYLNAAFAKVSGENWIDGTAVYYFLQDSMLGTPEALGSIILPLLQTPFVVVPTWGTILLEFVLFAALFMPKKYWKWHLMMGLLFHLAIALVIGLYSFVLIMFAGLLLFLRPLEQEFTIPKWIQQLLIRIRRVASQPLKGGELEEQSS